MLAFVTVCHFVELSRLYVLELLDCLRLALLGNQQWSLQRSFVCVGQHNSRILVRLVNYHYYVDDQEAFKLLYQEASAVLERAMQKLVRLPIHVN